MVQRILVGVDMKKLMIALLLCGMAGGVVAQERGPYLFDLPKAYPRTYAMWLNMVPSNSPAWLRTLDGTATPIRDVTVNGHAMKFGTICKPHDCADNIAGLLFTSQQDYIGALVSTEGSNFKTVGSLSQAGITCIAQLIGHERNTQC